MNTHNTNRRIFVSYDLHQTVSKPFVDVLVGVGQALDPLPSRGINTFYLNDKSAFASDMAKLVSDRDGALEKLNKVFGYRV